MNKTIIVVTTVVVLAVVTIALILRPAATTDTLLFEELEHRLGKLEHQLAKLNAKISDTEHATNVRKMQFKNEADLENTEDIDQDVMVRLQQVEETVAQADQTLSSTIEKQVEEIVDERVDELVDVIAYGEAKHPEAGKRFIKWLGRVMTEKIPGTDVTYGADIDIIKNNTREAFRSEFTEEQYAEFESWGVDPTEIQEIKDSPWTDLEERVKQRLLKLAE